MSPSSAGRAEKLGYTNVRVYHDGLPEWTKKNFTVLTAQSLKEAFLDKDIPVVLVDVRTAEVAQKGFIRGAVTIPAAEMAANISKFPPREMKAPIIIVDDTGGKDAQAAAKQLIGAGYTTTLLSGGMDAWLAAKYPIQTGNLATAITYVPKPRPGEVAIEEFKKIAAAIPQDTVILDVRNRDEASTGMIKGAVLMPDEEILDRLAEIPKNKQIIAYCSTGVRAEMAYHKLKDKDYNVKFLNAKVDTDPTGKFTVEKL
jgi:rhodanese-related sulfurtransferase